MNKLHAFMHRLHSPDWASLLLRIALGAVFINAGWLKLMDMGMTTEFFDSMGLAGWMAYLVAYCEFIGGILLVLGLFARYVGVVLGIIMLVATFLMAENGFSLAKGGFEYTFVLLLASLAIVTLGAGRFSIAGMVKK